MKISLYTIIYILLQNVLPDGYRLLFCLIIVTFMTIIKRIKIQKNLHIFLNFGILLLIGSVIGIGNKQWDYWRDFIYILQIIIYFLFGVYSFRNVKNFKDIKNIIISLGLVSAIIHICTFILDNSLINENIDVLRATAGRGSYVELIASSLVITAIFSSNFREVFNIKFGTFTVLVFSILSISFVLYFSRTMFLSLILIVLCLLNILDLRNKKTYFRAFLLFCAIVLVVNIMSTMSNFDIMTNGTKNNEIISKILNSKEEIFSNKVASFSELEINNNWRSYETYRAWLLFQNGDLINKTFGFGFGTLVDLGISIKLGTSVEFQKIPIFHNGYMYLLIKLGIIGVLFYVYFILKVGFSFKRILNYKISFFYSQKILEALCLIILINTFTISGIVNKDAYMLTIFLGFFWEIENHRVLIGEHKYK